MFKTVIKLTYNDRRRLMREVLNSPAFDTYTIHKFVYGLFPIEENAKFVYDAEYTDDKIQAIVIYSDIRPSTSVIEGCDYKISRFDLDDYFKADGVYCFQIDINPVKKKDGHVVLVRDNEIGNWLEKKMNMHGMTINFNDSHDNSFNNVNVTRRYRRLTPTKQKPSGVPMHVAQCQGAFRIIDFEKFKECVLGGIGREKAFGLGMLMVI